LAWQNFDGAQNEQGLIQLPLNQTLFPTTRDAPLCRARTIHHEVVPGNDRSSHARQIETYFKQMLQECNDDASSIVNRLTDAADGARGSALP
jgi:hypothetical protein